MAKYQYKTIDGKDYILPGIGATIGGVITTDVLIENHRFVQVNNTNEQPQVAAAPAAPATPVAPVQPAPVAPQPAAPATPVNPATPQNQTAKEQN